MTRPVLFIVDTMNIDGDHVDSYLSVQTHEGEIPITTAFFDQVLKYFNNGCYDCGSRGYVAVDITRIFDNGEQIYFDHESNIEEISYGSNNWK